MSKKAVYCKHIIPTEESNEISGYLLIEGETVEEILDEKRITPARLAEIKRQYQIIDCGNSYIIPGIVDINTHLCETFEEEWQDVLNITKMAAQGGVTTVLDNPQFNKYNKNFDEKTCIKHRLAALKGNLFVDCGVLALAGPNNWKTLDNIMEIPEVLGFRAYMAPCLQKGLPFWEEKQVRYLSKAIERSKHDITLSVHCESASARDLFLSSPCRVVDWNKRADLEYDIMDQRAFGGGHHGNIESDSDNAKSDEGSDEEEFEFKPLPSTTSIQEPQSPTSSILRIKANKVAKSQEEKYVSKLELMEYNHEDESSQKKFPEEGETLENNLKEVEGEDYINIDDDDSVIGSPMNFKSGESPLLGQSPIFVGSNVFAFPSPKNETNLNDSQLGKTPEKNEIKLISTPPNYKRQPPTVSRFSGLLNINEELSSPERVADDHNNEAAGAHDFNNELEDFMKEQEKLQQQKELERSQKEIGAAADSKAKLGLDLSRRQSRLLVRRTSAMNAQDLSPDLKASPLFMGINTKKEEQARRDAEKNKKYFCFLPNRPISWETNGIHFFLKFFRNNAKGTVIFTNLSSASLAFKIRQMKKNRANLRMYTDTAVPFLYFYSKIIGTGETIFKSSPPIRDKEERDLLLRMLRIQGLDTVSSFHIQAPFRLKNIENGNFRRAFDGLSSMGFSLQVVWTKLYQIEKAKLKKQAQREGVSRSAPISPSKDNINKLMNLIVRTLSANPSKIFKISSKKGSLEKGKDADFIVWNPFKVTEVRNVDIHMKHKKVFLYREHKFYGDIQMTFLRGDLIYRNNDGNKDFIQKGVILRRPS